jgi:hypothetical protein
MRLVGPALLVGVVGPLLLAIPAASDWTTDGRVVALDGQGSVVTLDHGPVGDLLPAARTEFPVARPELLHGLGLGDTVRVTLAAEDESHGILMITRLDAAADPARAGPWDTSTIALVAIGAAALLGLLALWLETRRLGRSLAEAREGLVDATRRHIAAQHRLNANVEAAMHALNAIARTLAGQLASAAERVQLVRANRATAELPAVPDSLPLFVVRAGDVDTYRMLSERLVGSGLAYVIWDRRRRDRRTGGSPVSQERRRRERREAPPPTWETLGCVAVSPAPDKHLPSVA